MIRLRSAAALLGGVLLLAGCGTTDPGDADQAVPQAATSSDCADDDTKTSTGPVELTDAFGRDISLDQPAERVAVLEWQQTEDLLTLCVPPVAAADVEGYELWDTAEEMPSDGVTDVGTRQEPNLETLYGTNPDLIVVEAYTAQDDILKQLAKYDVPVLATKGADAKDPIANMLSTFDLIAEATGREERAETVKTEFQNHLDEASGKLADADLETTDFLYFDGWIQGGNVAIRPFGQGSLIGEVGEELGLTNAFDGKVDPAYGLGQTDIEGLSKYGDANLIYTGTVDPAGDVMSEVEKNSIWKGLPAVEDGREYAFPAGIWTFGGPRSAGQIIDAYVDVLK